MAIGQSPGLLGYAPQNTMQPGGIGGSGPIPGQPAPQVAPAIQPQQAPSGIVGQAVQAAQAQGGGQPQFGMFGSGAPQPAPNAPGMQFAGQAMGPMAAGALQQAMNPAGVQRPTQPGQPGQGGGFNMQQMLQDPRFHQWLQTPQGQQALQGHTGGFGGAANPVGQGGPPTTPFTPTGVPPGPGGTMSMGGPGAPAPGTPGYHVGPQY